MLKRHRQKKKKKSWKRETHLPCCKKAAPFPSFCGGGRGPEAGQVIRQPVLGTDTQPVPRHKATKPPQRGGPGQRAGCAESLETFTFHNFTSYPSAQNRDRLGEGRAPKTQGAFSWAHRVRGGRHDTDSVPSWGSLEYRPGAHRHPHHPQCHFWAGQGTFLNSLFFLFPPASSTAKGNEGATNLSSSGGLLCTCILRHSSRQGKISIPSRPVPMCPHGEMSTRSALNSCTPRPPFYRH